MENLYNVEENWLQFGDSYLLDLISDGYGSNLNKFEPIGSIVWNMDSNKIEDGVCIYLNNESRKYNDGLLFKQADPYHSYLYTKAEMLKINPKFKPLPDIAVYKLVEGDLYLDHYEEVKTKIDCTDHTFNQWVKEVENIYYNGDQYEFDHKDFNTTKVHLVQANTETNICRVVTISTKSGAFLDTFEFKLKSCIYPVKEYIKKNLSNTGSHRWKH